MPDRIIKESVRRSKTLDSLSWFEVVCFLYLTTAADDYGRFYRDPQILKCELFPRKKDVSVDDVDAAMRSLESNGLIESYVWDDDTYLHIVKWETHQRTRAKKSKFPDSNGKYDAGKRKTSGDSPNTNDSNVTADDSNVTSNDVKCRQMPSAGQQMCPNSNTNSNTNAKTKTIEDPFASDDELISIQKDHDQIYDTAKSIGLPTTEKNLKDLTELYDSLGIAAVIYGMNEAARLNKVSLAYISSVAKKYGNDNKSNDGKMTMEEAEEMMRGVV